MSRDATGVWSSRARHEVRCPACHALPGEDCQDNGVHDWENATHLVRVQALTDLLNEQHHRPARTRRRADLGYAIGTELRRLRDDLGLSQQRVAERAGMLRPIYARLERGDHEPTLSTLLPVLASLQADPQPVLTNVLRRIRPTRAVHAGMRCADCTYFPLDASHDEGALCEHPALLPAPHSPRRHLHVTGDRSPPTECPLRKTKA